ncbi:MAG: hypothetical protein GF331_20370 [Chitinivibrionales bacterium]|nr:hypothetical protein [Chitinivibrionales bacterium]
MNRQPELHIVVFSKDRAAQLDSLLRSMRDHFAVPFATLTVLYRATDAEYAAGYALAERRCGLPVNWKPEQSFRADLLELVGSLAGDDRILFLVDDDIVFRRFDQAMVLQRFSPRHLFISLRCSRRYTSVVPPAFIESDEFLEWRWHYGRKKRYTWNYPFSLDGNIFHVRHMQRALPRVAFKAPNSLEGNLHTYRHKWWVKRIPLALAPVEAVVVNNPLNRVQTEGETPHQDIDPSLLNRAFLDGKLIDNRPYYAHAPKNVHNPTPITLIAANGSDDRAAVSP